jgi:hypothetical protein
MLGGFMLKKLSVITIAATVVFSFYVIGLKQYATCIACNIAATGLPISQLTLAVLALAGSLIIAISYYLSQRVQGFQYMYFAVSGVSACVASFLMTLQISHSICWPCLATDVLFYLIFILMYLDVIFQNKGKIKLGGIQNDKSV